jgi:uncharacterized membrane protein YoaK (UPF0700 family)
MLRRRPSDPVAREAHATVALSELFREPRERALRAAFLLLLTFSAGWVDALSYHRLGHVFSSFMTGNILFVGLSAVRGERALLVRALVALTAFVAGASLGTFVLGRVSPRQTRRIWLGTLACYLSAAWLILLGFAVAWQLVGDVPTNRDAQIALLSVAALAMGAQGALVDALRIPGVISDALTGTVLQLAKRFAERIDKKEPSHPLSTSLLLGLCLAYGTAAAAVTLAMSWPALPFVPVVATAVVILTLSISRGRAEPDSRH